MFFLSFFFLLRLSTLLKHLTLLVQNVLRSVLWLMLLGFHQLLSAHRAMKFFLFSFYVFKKERRKGVMVGLWL